MEVTTNSIFARMKAAASTSANKPSVTLADLAGQRDPEKVKKDKEVQATMQNVLAAMKNSTSDMAAQRKAAAMEKVARIKQAIQALKMSGIVDPKMVARIATRLAKELAAAVKEYAAAGGTASAVSAPGTTPAPAASASAEGSAQTGQDADQSDTPQVPPAQGTAVKTSEEPQDPEKKPETVKSAVNSYDQRQNGDKQTGKDQDEAFKTSVRDAIEELRKLLRQNRGLVTGRDKDRMDEAEKALKQAERVLATIGSGIGAPSVGVSVTA